MKDLMLNIVQAITHKPRYRPEFQWSSKSWTHNFFRALGLVFGERYGIRCMSVATASTDGKLRNIKLYTLEAVCAQVETMIRAIFAREWGFVKVAHLQLALAGNPNLQNRFAPYISLAIAVDNSAIAGAASSSVSTSYTCTGSNLLLIVTQVGDVNASTNTYNSVGMTQIQTFVQSLTSPARYASEWYLAGPATGSNTLTCNQGSGSEVGICIASYTGCSQTGIPDNSTTGTAASAPSLSMSLTPSATGCWIVGIAECNGGMPMTASNAAFLRQEENVTNGEATLMDTNGTASGSTTLTLTDNGSTNRQWAGVMASIAPPFVTAIKTVNGLAKASVKTVNGLAIASVKSINGLQ